MESCAIAPAVTHEALKLVRVRMQEQGRRWRGRRRAWALTSSISAGA
jgi:hypothetical protein